ncbi:hypothetical protein BBAD15_g6917 [Beauveria bassiana D1-5]|uniref:DUF7924 domain-containing protein n=1 Tax=Beauveria bassiana D1-5 TaxID=1245745 RepID=A0A0A2VIR8_BEABA|nr:hypothetical protein BBAD15_g6917 [Beauveria bassiana D1-5]
MSSPSSSSEQQSVSNVQNRKRPNPYDTTEDSPPAKRVKSTSAVQIASNFPPHFWDSLSKVWLTPRALREKDRRNGAQPPATVSAASVTPTTLARFARRGGPDLGHLRGYPEPKNTASMTPNRSSTPSSRRTQSTKATSVSSRAKRSSAYDKDFEQNLIDNDIYPEGFEHRDGRSTPEPNNLDEIVKGLAHPRASLSPSQFSVSAFKSFRMANSRVISEGKVMADILPTIRGNSEIPNEGNLPFGNLESITNGTTVDAVPDWYDGSYPRDINRTIRQELCKTIIPTSHGHAPAAPNFFVEAKAPRGGADVAKRQACLDGAVGARAMHSLKTYGEDEPVYDGNAHAYSSTYHNGQLMLYAHHVTGPTAERERPEYHMTQLKGYTLTGDRETFVTGATAFRNARDLARRQRETLIQVANARVLEAQRSAVGEHSGEVPDDSHPHKHINSSDTNTWQDFHDNLQQQIAETYREPYEDDGPTTPTHQYTSGESQDPGQDPATSGTSDPSVSFMSSFTSDFSADTTRPKRARQSLSSPTQEDRLPKSRSRATAVQRRVKSSTTTAESEL